jgi:hypothetical protein
LAGDIVLHAKKMFTNHPAAGIVIAKETVGTEKFITKGEVLK